MARDTEAWDWRVFCGNLTNSTDSFTVWENGYFSPCFEQLVFTCVSHAAVAVCSVYHLGGHMRCRIRGPIHRSGVLHLRWLTTLLLLLAASCLLLLIPLYLNLRLAWIDIAASGVKILAWLCHLGFLWRHHRFYHLPLRGPGSLLLAVVCAMVSVFLHLGSVIRDIQSQTTRLNVVEQYTSMAEAGLHVLYLLTLLPSARPPLPNIAFSVQSGEHQSLLSDASFSYGSLYTETRSSSLGVAEDDANIFSRLTFHWALPLMQQGKQRLLKSADQLFYLPYRLRTTVVLHRFHSKLHLNNTVPVDAVHDLHSDGLLSSNNSSASEKPQTLLRALNRAFGVEYYSLGILKLFADLLGFTSPILLNYLVAYIENQNEPFYHGYIYACGLMLSTLLTTLFSTQFDYRIQVVGLKVRASVIGHVYEHSLQSSSIALSKSSTGEIVNYMSTDTDRIVNFCPSFHQFWSLPFQLAVSLYLLYEQVGLAFIAGVAFGVLLVPINRWIALSIGRLSTSMMAHKDARVKLMSEILRGIRILKCYAWEPHFVRNIRQLREEELASLKGRKYLDAFCVYFWAATPVVISTLTFVTYVLLGHTLTAAKVFTSLALFNILIGPLNAFPWVINGLMEAWVSVHRIQHFLSIPSVKPHLYYTHADEGMSDVGVYISRGSFSWADDDDDAGTVADISCNGHVSSPPAGCLQLNNINLNIRRGSLVGVVGPVGSGKSSLLSAILAEMSMLAGEIIVPAVDNGFGLATQEAWVQQASFRDNILFGQKYSALRFAEVLQGCALLEDLKLFPKGEHTEIGENGVTLSGGQKARLALARAVYQDKDVYLLDDPLAAVDAFVAKHLFDKCIMGLLKRKTRILVTHHTKFLHKADFVIRMDQGKIVAAGKPKEVLSPAELEGRMRSESSPAAAAAGDGGDAGDQVVEGEGCLVMAEGRESGRLKWKVYLTYWKAVGTCLAPAIIFAVFLMQATRNATDWWLSYWVTHSHENSSTDKLHQLHNYMLSPLYMRREVSPPWRNITEAEDNVKFYLLVYGCLVGSNTVVALIRAFSYAYGGIVAARVMHSGLLNNIIKAPVSFFDVTPIGRILNRFSSDVYSVDDSLPFSLNILLAQLFSILGTIILTCYGLPWFSLLLLPLAALYYFIQEYYRHTSREIKRITSVTLSPIYNHFTETLTGIVTVRALRKSSRFAEENIKHIEMNQRAQYCGQVASSWLNLRLQMLGVAMVTGVAFIAILQHKFQAVNPGLVGLAISYALSITSLLSGAVFSVTETEKQMVAVERMGQYTEDVNPEPDSAVISVPDGWPKEGEVSFQKVTVQYRQGLPPALNDISFQTKPGEKIGIVGRTGAGKSSLFQVLFRLVPMQHGQIIIDGINIQLLELAKLRSSLAIIPQDPFLYTGTVRENLQPQGGSSDTELWAILQRCHLAQVVQQLGGLDAQVGERGHHFSAGQRQLVCLARALLTQAKVLCIDEATANVDHETDILIQGTIKEEFAGHTVLTIAHRLNTIMNYDRIIILAKGSIVECGQPYVLLENNNSLFYSMVHGTAYQ